MSEATSLFSPSLISPETSSSLPSPYKIRPLERTDYSRGFLECLSDLTWVGDYGEQEFHERFDWLATRGKDWYYTVVIDDGQRIVGTATMIVERKFIHNRGIIGHIEEVVVSKDLQGTGLGIKLIRAVDSIAVSVGCYRTTLGCSERNVGFYAKCGYEKAGTEMSHYYEPFTEPYKRG